MKAVVYNGPRDVAVTDVDDARIERPSDAIVRITTTNICGSDLHMYEGRTDFERGRTFGHENLGQVVEVGEDVERLQVGDWVCLPFNIACGKCVNCNRGLTNYCIEAQPMENMAGAAYGFADMGPYQGGQAEYLRAPWADFNALRLPDDAEEKQADYVMVADIFPTGWHATEMAGVQSGETVVIYGGGPVGLMAAYSATIKGACKVMVVERVLVETNGLGAHRGCECVGYQAHDPQGHEIPNDTLNKLVSSVRFTGGIGVVGVFVPEDPGSPDEYEKEGKVLFDFGNFWFRGQKMGTGQCPVKRYNRQLRNLIHAGKAQPSFIVSHHLQLDQAPEGYQHFDSRDDGWTKVVLHPNGTS